MSRRVFGCVVSRGQSPYLSSPSFPDNQSLQTSSLYPQVLGGLCWYLRGMFVVVLPGLLMFFLVPSSLYG